MPSIMSLDDLQSCLGSERILHKPRCTESTPSLIFQLSDGAAINVHFVLILEATAFEQCLVSGLHG